MCVLDITIAKYLFNQGKNFIIYVNLPKEYKSFANFLSKLVELFELVEKLVELILWNLNKFQQSSEQIIVVDLAQEDCL